MRLIGSPFNFDSINLSSIDIINIKMELTKLLFFNFELIEVIAYNSIQRYIRVIMVTKYSILLSTIGILLSIADLFKCLGIVEPTTAHIE